MFRVVLVFLSSLTLIACGFKLRGDYDVPASMHKTFLKAAHRNSEMTRNLKRYLLSAGVEIVERGSESTATLEIVTESSGQRVVSIDNRGRPQEYEISYTVIFSVRDPKSKFIIPDTTLLLTRDYIFDPTQALAAHDEESILRRDMQRELARLIMERLVKQ